MEKLVALGVESRDQDSTAKSLNALKNEMAKEKLARLKVQTDAETLSWAVKEMKRIVDQLTVQVPSPGRSKR
jgi:hypothetical protein